MPKSFFWCSKETVRQIAEYQKQRYAGFDGEADKVIAFLEKQQSLFGYEDFMTVLYNFVSLKKMPGDIGRFVIPFIARMKSYRRGEDWRKI
jgi:hypothetical protein